MSQSTPMLAVLLASLLLPQAAQPAYDPLATAAGAGASLALVAHDAARTRDVPLRVWLPPVPAGATAAPAPVILWSHGLGGSRDNSPYLGKHWSARGYVVVCMQHAGSDESVWRDVPLRERMDALRKAASAANYVLRGEDVKFVLDQLTLWNRDAGHELHGRLDLDRVGMTGHSFGAVTTQAVSGQGNALQGQKHRDPRIDAVDDRHRRRFADRRHRGRRPPRGLPGVAGERRSLRAGARRRRALRVRRARVARRAHAAQPQPPPRDPGAVDGVLGRAPARRCRGARLAARRRAAPRARAEGPLAVRSRRGEARAPVTPR
jgi:hypothetical protein